MVEVGPHWDAVRVPAAIGERTLALLGSATGAVIADYSLTYWLIWPGDADNWHRIRSVNVLTSRPTATTYVGVPPITRTAGPCVHWRVPMAPGRYRTRAPLLHEALIRAVIAELGPAEEVTVR